MLVPHAHGRAQHIARSAVQKLVSPPEPRRSLGRERSCRGQRVAYRAVVVKDDAVADNAGIEPAVATAALHKFVLDGLDSDPALLADLAREADVEHRLYLPALDGRHRACHEEQLVAADLAAHAAAGISAVEYGAVVWHYRPKQSQQILQFGAMNTRQGWPCIVQAHGGKVFEWLTVD